MYLLHKRPAYLLLLLWLGCLAVCAATAWLALQQPWLGVKLAARDGKVRVLDDVSQKIPRGAEVLHLVSATVTSISPIATDLLENADYFPSYAQKNEFFARQSALDAILHSSTIGVVWASDDGSTHTTWITPSQRPWSSLSVEFYFQLATVSTAFMIACWVFLMRPQDWGTRMFALSGLTLLVGGISGALMSERSLALDGGWFRTLDDINSLSAHIFGGTIFGMFLIYPRQLVAPYTLLWIPVLCLLFWLTNIFHAFPTPNETMYAISILVLLSFISGGVQWWFTRGQLLERAALRWFLLAVLLAASLFTLTNVLPPIFDKLPLLPVSYAIGFFLIMYVGIALGLRRYRLFDIDEWAYRVFLWVAGATAVISLDALLIFSGLTEGASLSLSLLLCGWLYFPFRQWLWGRIVSRQTPTFESLLPELSSIAFTTTPHEQQTRWQALLQYIYDPLEIKPGDAGGGSGIREEGLSMQVPGCANFPPFTLRYAGHGARLFSSRDAIFAASLSELLEQIMSGRSSYEQGVAQERLRIGRDLHDNIGARLLKLIHHLRGTPNAEVARDAMKDLRTTIASMDTRPVPLRNALADWRAEADARCEVAECRLQWQQNEALPEIELTPRVKATLESVMREIITNALKHASPRDIEVDISVDKTRLHASVTNNGDIPDPLTWKDGYGLRNMRGRMEELGGRLTISATEDKVRLTIEVPLA